MRYGVLASGGGSNLQSMLDAHARGDLDHPPALVIVNRPRAKALDRAKNAGIAGLCISHRRFSSRESFEQALIEALQGAGIEWVVLAGFMRLLTPYFLDAFEGRVVNIHPALLPSFPGVDAQRQAFDYGVKVAGCTVHLVDAGTDTGPILAQRVVPVLDGDDVEGLRARILEAEHTLYPEVLQRLARGRLRRDGRRVLIEPR